MSGPATSSAEFPLSFGQESLWLVEQMAPGNSAYNMAEAWRLKGTLDLDALRWSLDEMVRRHETLRTAFRTEEGKPVQSIYPPKPFGLEVEQIPAEPGNEATLQARLKAEALRPFDLSVAPLMRMTVFQLGAEEQVLALDIHHLISDEWSMGVLLGELAELYAARLAGKPSPLPEPAVQYGDFTVWQRELAADGMLNESLAYWKSQLSGELPVLGLPTDFQRPAVGTLAGATQFFTLRQDLTERLKSLARREGATLFMVLLAAFKTLLHRYSGQEEIIVGAPVASRMRPELEGLIGFFVNSVALRTRLEGGDLTFVEVLRRVREVTLAAFAHQEVPFELVLKELQLERSLSHHPVFQLFFGQQPAAKEDWRLAGVTAQPIELDNGASKFDLSLLATETRGGLRVRCEYRSELFEARTIARMWSHFELLLEGIAGEPTQALSRLPMVPKAEQEQLLKEWNATEAQYPREKCLHELFQEQAERTPAAAAIAWGKESMSYGELAARAEALAENLRALNVGPDVLVAVCLQRTPQLIVAILAVLKAGGAYVPMDPSYPGERLAFMLEDTQASVLVTERKLLGSLAAMPDQVVCLEEIQPSSEPETIQKRQGQSTSAGAAELQTENQPRANSRNLAYVIYTSGSTGKPKGVALEHRGAVALVSWARNWFQPHELSGVLASTSICFDLSIFELFVPLCCGGKVIMAENALALPTLPAANEVTLINTVPSAMRELLRMKGVPPSVRVVNLAGEPLPTALVEQIYHETSAEKVYDLYGPTETTTYSTGGLRKAGEPASIGRPLANEQVYLLDRHLQPVPIGVPGELFIGGDGLARGYLKRPELTAEKFIAEPFQEPGTQGRRLYRTGDLARWRADGKLEFLGRLDHQVKVRGFRIELGEVESALKKHPEVAEAVVMARGETNKRLVAYVVPKPGKQQGSETMRCYMEKFLPQFMVPSDFIFLGELPLSPNGKLDRKALPSPESVNTLTAENTVAARNETEAALVEIWREILERKAVGIHENFFRIGGHSLLATQVISRIGKKCGVELPLRSIFESPTIAALAGTVQAATPSERVEPEIRRLNSSAKPAELLGQLETLSDEEVDELLRELDDKSLMA